MHREITAAQIFALARTHTVWDADPDDVDDEIFAFDAEALRAFVLELLGLVCERVDVRDGLPI